MTDTTMTDTTAARRRTTRRDPPQADRPALDPAISARREAARWFGRGVGAAAGALVVVALAAAFLTAWRVVLLVFVAVLIGSALEPLVGRLRGRLPIPRGAALLVVYVGFFALVGLVVLLVLPGSLAQAVALAAAAPEMVERARTWADGVHPDALSAALRVLIDAVGGALQPGPPPTPGAIVAAGLSVAEAVVSVVTVLALVYFWMTERARLQRFTLSFLPAQRRSGARNTWNDVELRLGGWVRGQLVLMTAVGVLTGTACWLIGLPSPLLLGLIAGLAEIIPLVGPAIGAIPAVVVAASVGPEALVLVLLAYVVIHLVEGNVLVPIVMRNAVGISPFLVIACLLIGGALDGFRGALVAVPVAASIEVILERLQDRELPVTPTAEGVPAGGSSADVTDPQPSTTAV